MATVTWRYHCGICGDKRGIFGGIYFTGVYRCDECSDWEMNNAYEWYLEHLDNGGRALGHLGKGKEVAGKGQVKEEQVFWCCEKGKGKKGKGKEVTGKGRGQEGQSRRAITRVPMGQSAPDTTQRTIRFHPRIPLNPMQVKGYGKKGKDTGKGKAYPDFLQAFRDMAGDTEEKARARHLALNAQEATPKPKTNPKKGKAKPKPKTKAKAK